MWIYDIKTLAFLDVNDAAVQRYGYSEEEFLSMTIKDIRPPEDIPSLLENIAKVTKGLDIAGTWRHIKKDGTLIHVEIISHTLTFLGKRAEMVLALDITQRKRLENELILLAKQSGTMPSS
jgi:PAS domain S-box-containing protein